jgi:hypothetical protein
MRLITLNAVCLDKSSEAYRPIRISRMHEVYVSGQYLHLIISCLCHDYYNLNRTTSEFNKLGLGCAFIGVLVLFAFFNHSSPDSWSKTKINWDSIEKTLASDNGLNGYSQETVALIIIWILLMIAGSYLLVHIHFRVLREEKR